MRLAFRLSRKRIVAKLVESDDDDALASLALQANAAAELARERSLPLFIDLSGLRHMRSNTLRALAASLKAGAPVVLARPETPVREILAISGYDRIFRVADTLRP